MDTQLESLLDHSEWVQRLARRLVRDPELADDLVQETWLSVLQLGELPIRSARALLATVLRSRLADRARSDARRLRRESVAARPEAVPSTDELFERTAAQHEVVEAVLALPEPYRAVLLRRYFEREPPRVIAAQLDLPLATVKTRLSRGLARLREALDERHGGDGRAWALALGPLLRPRPVLTGGAVLAWLGAALVLVALVPLGARLLRERPRGLVPELARAAQPDAERPTPSAPEAAGVVPALPAGARAPVASPVSAAALERAPLESLVVGRVRDLAGRAVGGLVVQRRTAGANSSGTAIALCDAEGRFSLRGPRAAGSLVAVSADYSTAWAGVSSGEEGSQVDLVVAPRLRAGGSVVDSAGVPLPGVRLALRLPEAPPAASGARGDTCAAVAPLWHSAADGRFEILDAPFVPEATLEVSAPGMRARSLPLEEVFGRGLTIQLEPLQGDGVLLSGRVVDAAGAGVPGALVSDGAVQVTSGADGSFRLHTAAAPERLVAVAAGFLPTTLEADAAGHWPTPLLVRLSGEPLRVSGRVLAADGSAVQGAWVWIDDPTLLVQPADDDSERVEFGSPLPGLERLRPPGALLESVLAGEPDAVWRRTTTDASGAFELDGLAQRAYRVVALDRTSLARSVLADVEAGRADLRLELDGGSARASLAGRVVDPEGRPLAGVAVVLEREALSLQSRGAPVWTQLVRRPGVASNDAGRFELQHLPEGQLVLRFQGEGLFTRRLPMGDLAPDGDVLVERACALRVLLPPGDAAIAFEVLDGSGAALEIESRLGDRTRRRRRAPLLGGRSDDVHVGETAREVVLIDAAGERRSVPLRPVPGTRVDLRP